MVKGFKIRIYPNKEQEELMWKHIGCCRYVYNHVLALQIERRARGEKFLQVFDMVKSLTALKHDGEHDWLNEVSARALQRTVQDLYETLRCFFIKAKRHPKFKSKKTAKAAYPTDAQHLSFHEGKVYVQKLGYMRYKTDFDAPEGRGIKFLNPRISHDRDKWFISFSMECENQAHQLSDKVIGIDLGVKNLATVAVTTPGAVDAPERLVFHNINKTQRVRRLKRRLAKVNRMISRKYTFAYQRTGKFDKSRKIARLEKELSKIHARLNGIRKNHVHQTTHALVALHPSRVVMEDLNVQGMLRNRHLSGAIGEQLLSTFILKMQYKCGWRGIQFVQVGQFYPSSKTCSACGRIKRDLKLKDRTFVCPVCGFTEDRDFNAALNLARFTDGNVE